VAPVSAARRVAVVTGASSGIGAVNAIAYVVTRPPHVDVDYVSIKPTAQATARDVHRE
jgi:NADP-dependent 3-hydroxy acid dehydrogenase YdfG